MDYEGNEGAGQEAPNYDVELGNQGSQDDNAGPSSAGNDAAQQQAGAATDPQTGAQGQQPQSGEWLPKYRYDEVARQNQQLSSQVRVLQGMIAQATGIQNVNQPQADPRKERIRQQLLDVIPELKEILSLAPKAKDILGLAHAAPEWQQQNAQYWDTVAESTLTSVLDTAAQAILGPGKTGKELDPNAQRWLANAFVDFVEKDPARVRRYHAQDPTLRNDFWRFFETNMIAPARRRAAVSVQQRGAARANLPQGGGSMAPVGQQVPKPNLNDEDAVLQAAWNRLQELQAGSV